MLTNFIADTDLVALHSNLMSYIPAGQTFLTKRTRAFELVLIELQAREIDPRDLHIPIDLNRDYDSTTKEDQLIPLTKTASGNSSKHAVGLVGFRRFAVNISAFAGTSIVFTLQGSNDILEASTDEPVNWNTVTTLSFTAVGLKTIAFDNEYKYYRLYWVIVGASPSITFTSGLYETSFDQLIIQKTFSLIYHEWATSKDEIYFEYMKIADQDFETTLSSIKFVLDTDKDNIPDEEESGEGSTLKLIQ